MDLPSATGAFGKLKTLFTKIIPFIGAGIGFFVGPWIIGRLIGMIEAKFGKTGTKGTIESLTEYMYAIPAGLIAGGGVGIMGYFARSLSPMLGNFVIGVATGLFLFALYYPWRNEVNWYWW